MDPKEEAEVFHLFDQMAHNDEREHGKKRKRSNRPGTTNIIDSTVVICSPQQAADLVRELRKKRPKTGA